MACATIESLGYHLHFSYPSVFCNKIVTHRYCTRPGVLIKWFFFFSGTPINCKRLSTQTNLNSLFQRPTYFFHFLDWLGCSQDISHVFVFIQTTKTKQEIVLIVKSTPPPFPHNFQNFYTMQYPPGVKHFVDFLSKAFSEEIRGLTGTN